MPVKVFPNLNKYIDEDSVTNCEKSDCGQIVTKCPTITKDFLDKMQHPNLTQEKTWFCGKQFRTNQVLVLSGLLILFIFSLGSTLIFWCTDTYDNEVLTKLKLLKGSRSFEMWMKPSAQPLFRVHIFNYTNVEDYLNGDAEKLNVKDVGPFTYRQTNDRADVEFHDNGTISYQDKKHYQYLPELSNGLKEGVNLVVPNLPMLGAVALTKDRIYLSRLALYTTLLSLNAKPFLTLPANDFMWGYEDSLFNLAKGILAFNHDLPYEHFGLLAARNGTSRQRITINGGDEDVDLLCQIEEVNGKTEIGHWSTEECNKINGTDGSSFSPYRIRNKETVAFYEEQMCRNFPFQFNKDHYILDGKIRSYRYAPPKNVFSYPENKDTEENSENACYCDAKTGKCPTSGVFNAADCAYGTPLYLSFPHFLWGDESLVNQFTGLKPEEAKHETFLEIHPSMGFTMGGATRFQINIKMEKSVGINQLDNFKQRELIMPVAWVETLVDIGKLPPHLIDVIYKSTYTILYIGLAFKWGSLLTCMVTLTALLIVVRGNWKRRCLQQNKLQINLSGETERITLESGRSVAGVDV